MNEAGPVRIAMLIRLLLCLAAASGCSRERDDPGRRAAQKSERRQPDTMSAEPAAKAVHLRDGVARLTFDVNWPPVDPRQAKRTAVKYLDGELTVRYDEPEGADKRLTVSLRLVRPHATEADRKSWNRKTSFPQYRHWMPYVWDAGKRWLWPNLAFLFTLHGTDRQERYGGWDPGHHVDNDFGGVLIRKYDITGRREHPDTKSTGPLVSGNWYPVGVKNAARDTVVHVTVSDEFTVHLGGKGAPTSGRLKVWFIYGDLMRQRVPATWPRQRECNGATIAFFHIDWEYGRRGDPHVVIVQRIPPDHTGFDWEAWIGRPTKNDTAIGEPRLVDR